MEDFWEGLPTQLLTCAPCDEQLQSGLTAMLYVKSSRVSCNVSKGEVMTLATTDVSHLKDLSEYIHAIWSAPLAVVVALSLTARLLGPSVLAGAAMAVVVLAVNWRASMVYNKVNDTIMENQQTRMQRFAEIIEVTSCRMVHSSKDRDCGSSGAWLADTCVAICTGHFGGEDVRVGGWCRQACSRSA